MTRGGDEPRRSPDSLRPAPAPAHGMVRRHVLRDSRRCSASACSPTITRRFDRELDASLRRRDARAESGASRRATARRSSARRTSSMRSTICASPIARCTSLDTLGAAARRRGARRPWIRARSRRCGVARGAATASHHAAGDRMLRAHAERFTLAERPSARRRRRRRRDRARGSLRVAHRGLRRGGARRARARRGGRLVPRAAVDRARRAADRAHAALHGRRRARAAHAAHGRCAAAPRSRCSGRAQPDDYVPRCSGIERESERLGRIVEDLLMLARADAGERPIERAARLSRRRHARCGRGGARDRRPEIGSRSRSTRSRRRR